MPPQLLPTATTPRCLWIHPHPRSHTRATRGLGSGYPSLATLVRVTRSHSVSRTLALIPGWGLVAGVGLPLMALYLFPGLQTQRRVIAMAASFIAYGVIAWALATLLIALGHTGRRRWLTLIPAAGLILNAAWCLPYVPHSAPTASGTTFKVLSLNAYYGLADVDDLTAKVHAENPDAIVLVEMTQTTLDRVKKALPEYSYQSGEAARRGDQIQGLSGPSSVMITRLPARQAAQPDTVAGLSAAAIEKDGRSLVVVPAHPENMVREREPWISDAKSLVSFVKPLTDRPLLIAGDFNAVPEHYTYRLLTGIGLHGASEQAGAGWVPTYPANKRIPPLIPIDHMLLSSSVTAMSFQTFTISGTDHLGIVAEVVVK